MSYSPDGIQLIIWDQKYVPLDKVNSYYVHRFTIANRRSEILKQGIDQGPFFGGAWRDDGKLVLYEPHGEFSTPYYFDLANRTIVKTPGTYDSGLVSESGKAMAVQAGSTSDICNDMSGESPDSYNIIDPVSGVTLGTISSKRTRVRILAFSADDREVLYQTEKIQTNEEDCSKPYEKSYFKTRIGTRHSDRIDDPHALPSGWNRNYLGAAGDYDGKAKTYSIVVGNRPIVTSKMQLRVIAQYYQ